MDQLQPQQIAGLIQAAASVRRNAYAPYSKFAVGAALLGANGSTYAGCNVENASFGLTICAERAAVTVAVAAGCRKFVALAVVAESGDAGPVTPCGACRQALAEFSPDLTVVCANPAGQMQTFCLDDLLPHRFQM